MTPSQRERLPDALREQFEAAQGLDLRPTTQVATIVEAANGTRNWLVLGSWVDEGNNEYLLRTHVHPDGRISDTESSRA